MVGFLTQPFLQRLPVFWLCHNQNLPWNIGSSRIKLSYKRSNQLRAILFRPCLHEEMLSADQFALPNKKRLYQSPAFRNSISNDVPVLLRSRIFQNLPVHQRLNILQLIPYDSGSFKIHIFSGFFHVFF